MCLRIVHACLFKAYKYVSASQTNATFHIGIVEERDVFEDSSNGKKNETEYNASIYQK